MPITSRGDVAAGVEGMRIFNAFLPSFLATSFPTAFPCAFEFWLAYDMGDVLLDSVEGEEAMKRVFVARTRAVGRSMCGNHSSECMSLQLRRFRHSHTLTALWNGLNEEAYREGAHYIFMPNDDLLLETPGWPHALLQSLAASPLYPNLGVTGPRDSVSGRGDMPSMPLIHRTHLDIFGGQSLPSSFQNWYNDVWLGNVYRPFGACLLSSTIRSRNHHGCTDPQKCSRYILGDGALAPWREETIEARARVIEWLRSPAAAAGLRHIFLNQPRLATESADRGNSPASVVTAILEGTNLYELISSPITLG
jgi:hypothetical protein